MVGGEHYGVVPLVIPERTKLMWIARYRGLRVRDTLAYGLTDLRSGIYGHTDGRVPVGWKHYEDRGTECGSEGQNNQPKLRS